MTAHQFSVALLFYVLIPGALPFGSFLLLYAVAAIVGAISRLPGGLGVFDAAFLALLSYAAPVFSGGIPALVGSLILYRLLYFVLPLVIGSATLIATERNDPSDRLDWTLPSLGALAVFIIGTLLLLSGATPGIAGRVQRIQEQIPLSLLEASNLLAAGTGAVLLFLARGLERRQWAAYRLSAALLPLAAVFSVLRGGSYEAALSALLVFTALVALRGLFFRRSTQLLGNLSSDRGFAVLVVIMATAWLTVFANRPVALNRYLWLEVSPEASAARSLRSLGAASAIAGLVFAFRGTRRLFRGRADSE